MSRFDELAATKEPLEQLEIWYWFSAEDTAGHMLAKVLLLDVAGVRQTLADGEVSGPAADMPAVAFELLPVCLERPNLVLNPFHPEAMGRSSREEGL